MMIFLSSIPRSGSTLLASLLGQRPDTYVSPTSNLGDIMGAVVGSFETNPATKAGQCSKEELYRTLKGIGEAKYAHREEPIIIDKGRMWPSPQIMETMSKVLGEPPKIIATVRPIAECISSFYVIDKGADIKQWIKTSSLMDHLMQSYQVLKAGYEEHPENFCLLEYENLCNHPQEELDRISDFIGVECHTYSPHIDQVKEDDNAWNIENLHTLGSTIKKTGRDPRQVLGSKLFEHYQGGEFWNDNPAPVKEKTQIDVSLETALRGEHDRSYQILKEVEKTDPTDDRIAFNLGWHELKRGNLLAGHKLLDRGRNEDVFGNQPIGSYKPIWNGQRDVTVLMVMEGGLGDQLQAIKYAKDIAEYGNKVVVVGSPELASILKDCEGVAAFAQTEAALGIYHDYWLPSMSAIVPLGYEYKDLKGVPYIKRSADLIPGQVGVRWSGNPKFEHEQHRLFPANLMFDAVEGYNCVSLQRDKDVELKPKWMKQAPLEDWQATRRSISECELVISSCTSIAHLAAAMGIETWIVLPVLPYYLWALPGDVTPHYDSATLFRQEKYGDWSSPFEKIKEQLRCTRMLKKAA
jgi:hypothetical protein